MSKLKFKCGTEVLFTDSITVRRTYGGLMLGEANEKLNKHYLEMFLGMSEHLMNYSPPFIIEPILSSDKTNLELPEFTCSVSLTHHEPAKDQDQHMSLTTIVWYQDENPIFEGFKLQKLALSYDWAEVSKDGCW